MKKKILILIFSVLYITLTTSAQDIVWDFGSNMQGWHDLGDGRDVVASWEAGSLKMTYINGAPTQGPQLWFAAVEVNQEFDSKDYPFLEIFYKTVNWPTTLPVKFLITFKNSNLQSVYSYAELDPTKNSVSVEIGKFIMNWGQLYVGTMKSVQLELPHNGSAASTPASAWFGASTLIDKVVLTSTPGVLPPAPFQKKSLHWSFDKDFADSTKNITGVATGNPVITNSSIKKGSGALFLSGTDYLTFPADTIFSNAKITYTCWVKTPLEGQTNPASAANILSYGSTKFELALYQNNLSLRDYRTWRTLAGPWKNNEWQRIAVTVDGNIVNCYINGMRMANITLTSQNRTGNLMLGSNGLKAILDELTIYNYVLSYEEILADGLTPPTIIKPWTFDKDLEGWLEVQDGNVRDVSLSWDNGSMKMTYEDKAVNNGPQLWFPQAEVKAEFDANLFPYCDITYETTGWPVTTPVKALLEFRKPDNTIAYAYFDLDPTKTFVRVNIAKSDPTWGVQYTGKIASIRLELPHNGSANPAENWFGASTKINDITFNNYQAPADDVWNETLKAATFNKKGMTRLNNSKFQYQTIGLGGTTMRVDPWGFGYQKAPNALKDYNHTPSFGYEYWWDTTGHRYNPFHIKGGYGDLTDPGTITDFEQNLDVLTGVLETKLTLNVGGTVFNSTRETFITPEGILVIRVKDSGAPSPLKLHLAINGKVELFGTYYAGEEDPFVRDAVNTSNRSTGAIGGVVSTLRQNTSDCAVGVAIESTSTASVSPNSDMYSQTSPDGTIIFYIAPTSSYNPLTKTAPWDHAWNAASSAKNTGYNTLKEQTATWWRDFLNVSKVTVPDEKVMKLYTQSLYYHGIYFGNGKIPPGCFGTDIYGFFGAACPEYDLTFSSYAMAYSGRIKETKNIADWVYSVLPKAKEHATNGIWHHDVFRKYNEGALYTTLMGYDGALTVQGETFEGQNLYENYPGINSAKMALNYLDYSDDQSFAIAAHDVLKSTTYVALEDLVVNAKGFYQDGKYPNSMQQGAVLAGFQECVKRGIAQPEWITKYQNKILMPQGILNGDTLLSAGVGHSPLYGEGSATYFYPLWWANVIDKHDPRAIKAIDNFSGTFQPYCFNNAWSGVHAAKIYRGDDALMWLKNFERPDVLLDETSFAENADAPGYKYTPAIGAHGGYICNLTQMLIDPDNDSIVDIFPAVPNQWEYQKIGFEGLRTNGALSFTAERDLNGLKVSVTNKANTTRERKIRIKIPRFLDITGTNQLTIENGFIVKQVSLMPNETITFEYAFSTLDNRTRLDEFQSDSKHFKIFPNPASGGFFNISEREKIDEVVIYNMQGQMVKMFGKQDNSFDISDLNIGIYLIHLKVGNEYYAKQLFISK